MNDKVLLFVGGTAYPPSMGGASSVMFSLLKGIDEKAIEVITAPPGKVSSQYLPFDTFRIRASGLGNKKWVWRLHVLEDVVRYLKHGHELTSTRKYGRLLLVFPDTSALIAGFILAREMRLPYQVYLLDLLADSRLYKVEWGLLKLFERRILQNAEKVYCLTRGIEQFYKARVKREYVLLPHCIPVENIQPIITQPGNGKKKIIAFAGQIHEISLDALQNIIKAIRLIDEFEVTVRIYTNRPHSYLQENGLLDEFVEPGYVLDFEELLSRLRQADLLLSPVSFQPRYPNQAMTCFPTKTFDYVRARRPILVHASADYFYTRYMAEHGAAFCATSFDPVDLKDALVKLLKDSQMQENLVESAVAMVETHHTKKEIQGRLVRGLFGKD